MCHDPDLGSALGGGGAGGGGGGNWVNFCWVCAAGLSEPLSIIVYSVANYRPHVSHFLFIYLQSATKLLRHCTSENKIIRTPPLSPLFKVEVFVVFNR